LKPSSPSGGLRLIGADYLVFKDAWDANHQLPPQLMGNGAFVNWHPHVSCNSFVDPKPSP